MDETRDKYGFRRITPEVIQEAVDTLRAAAPGATIIVFGSHARGTATEDSDLDLMVVEEKIDDYKEEWMRLRRLLRKIGLFPDLILVPHSYFLEWKDVKGSVFYEACHEGMIHA